jgi:hypothetical protein
MDRHQHLAEAARLVAQIDAYLIGDFALPDGMTADTQLRLAELHIALADRAL